MSQKSIMSFKWHRDSKISSGPQSGGPTKRLRQQSGQVVIEYMLLLVLVTSLGAVMIKGLVSRSADEPGLLVAKWHSIIKTIADDNPEE